MLVPHNDDVLDRELAVVIVLVDPLVEVVEALLVRDVKHQYTAVRAAVITRRQGTKPLLSRRIPQLESHLEVIGSMHKGPALAIHAYCSIVLTCFSELCTITQPH